MLNTKMLLAHCSKTGKKFCIEIRAKRIGYEAVNFIDLSEDNYRKLKSEVTCSGLISAGNLLPCKYCSSRKVAGCSCRQKKKRCSGTDKYDFQCMYCDCLSIDPPKSTHPRIYVTSRNYDDIGEVLTSMKLPYKPFRWDFDCDILFINCGTSDSINPNELAAFVRRGGCLYASDLASCHIQAAFPGMIAYENRGNIGAISTDVVDTELMQITGKQLEVNFDLGCWSVVSKTKGNVLLRASAGTEYAGKPIMISFKYGEGTVFYTSFHNHRQASEKERMLLQLLLMKQIGATTNQSIEEVGSLVGLNISSMKDRFRRG